MPPYVVLHKSVGETPLQCVERWRETQSPAFAEVSLAYAGRLDPMASGKLLVLIGDECKQQEKYHGLDKAYDFSVLLGIDSDTHDVLGRLTTYNEASPTELESSLQQIADNLVGDIELPYPHFSSKTIQGKPLHQWTLEGRLKEITIPTNNSTIYSLKLTTIQTKTRKEVAQEARHKIDLLPEVTEASKALGQDFRRKDVRADWAEISSGNFGPHNSPLPDSYKIAHFHCIASSGTYMRSLAHLIGQKLDIGALAWSIHRTNIGIFNPLTSTWTREF